MPDLVIREIHILRGPNVWTDQPVLEAWVESGGLDDESTATLPGFKERLKAWLPGMGGHSCGRGGGPCIDSACGASPAHLLERVTLELQAVVGHGMRYGKVRPIGGNGLYQVIVGFVDESVAADCLRCARNLLVAAYHGEPFKVAMEIELLRDSVDNNALGPSSKTIVDAAVKRGIPWRRLRIGRSLIQLGQGVKQRRVWTAETDRSGAIAEFIAQDKDLTRSILRRAGVPVPAGRVVADIEDAWDAAQSIGLPVVLKPRDGNHGRGVFIDLRTRQQVEEAYTHASKEGDGVIVERFIPGVDHRLLVVGGRMVAASRGEPAVIVGDGKQTVHELIESQLNSDPRRGSRDTEPWAKIDTVEWDPTVMADLSNQGHGIGTVPREGERVLVSRFANPSVDVTDEVHASVSEHVVVAARVAGLDVSGVDVVCCDIRRPLEEQGGAIVEINASPGLHVHLEPAVGKGRPVGDAIVEMLFPNGDSGRIPVIGVTGTGGGGETVRIIARLLRDSGKFLGVSSSDGMQFGSRRAECAQGARFEGAQGVLLHPRTEVAVCEASVANILRQGLAFDRCRIGVVLGALMEEPDQTGVDSVEQISRAMRRIVEMVEPDGTAILNADDPLVVPMAQHCRGGVIFFTTEPANAIVAAHSARGGRTVQVVEDGVIRLVEGFAVRLLCALADLGMMLAGRGDNRLGRTLAAVGVAWAFGMGDDAIREGLSDFFSES